MFIEFDESLINIDYIRIIFINGYTINTHMKNDYRDVIEMHFYDSIEGRGLEDISSLKVRYEYFQSTEKCDARYEELKKLLLLKKTKCEHC